MVEFYGPRYDSQWAGVGSADYAEACAVAEAQKELEAIAYDIEYYRGKLREAESDYAEVRAFLALRGL